MISKATPENIWQRIEIASKAVEVARPTYLKWKERGFCPPSQHHELVGAAWQCGVPLTHCELHQQWKERK